jgi:signal transduction histidine kinase/ActR/RegA family two-component response regulator
VPSPAHTDEPRSARAYADRYRSFLQLTSEGVWYCAFQPAIRIDSPVEEQIDRVLRDSVIVEYNDALARMYGVDRNAPPPPTQLEAALVAAGWRNREQLRVFISEGYRRPSLESTTRAPDGTLQHHVTALVGVVEEGLLVGTWGSQLDVTETRRLEAQARQTELVTALNRLAGGVAHDFNNLLTTVLTAVDMLEESLEPTHAGRQDTIEIRRAARRGAELTRQLLALSQQQVLVARPVDLNLSVRRAVNVMRRTLPPTVELSLTTDSAPALASVDSDELEHVLATLGEYSADSMRKVGSIEVTVSVQTVPQASLSFPDRVEAGDYVVVRYADSAPPFQPAAEAHLFEPFFGVELTMSASGLALATLRGFTRQSGASVVLDNPVGGRCLSLYFPLVAAAAPPPPVSAADADTTRNILIAEDEPSVRLLMKRVLQRAGYNVLVASTGEEALELAQAFGPRIDALVTDVIMPGMGGGELSRRLRKEQPDLRVLHVSGYTAGALRHHEALEPGAVFLPKPFTPRALLSTLQDLLATRSGHDDATR